MAAVLNFFCIRNLLENLGDAPDLFLRTKLCANIHNLAQHFGSSEISHEQPKPPSFLGSSF